MRKRLALPAALAAALLAAGPAWAAQDTTARTIQKDDRGGLRPAAGDEHLVREDLAAASEGRKADRRDLLFFAQMSDTHVIDEESPLRVEFTDKFGGIFTSAYRPQEGLTAQVLNQMVARLRTIESPVAGNRKLELVMTTGDNTDNAQCNEARWMIDVMSGNGTVTPDSGLRPGQELGAEELCLDGSPDEAANLPVPPSCQPTDGSRYDGVRGGEYYEPDDDEGEDPRYAALNNYPDLFERMNEGFKTEGFDDIPWYAVFGNHDGLLQGNQPRNPAFEAIGVGCVKVTGLSNAQAQAIRTAPNEETAMALAVKAMEQADPTGPGAEVIAPDPRRRPLRKSEWIGEHLRDAPTYGHGFSAANLASGMGNYSLKPKPGERLRFIALDSISEHGLEEGNLDDAQFRWLHEELTRAEAARERVVVFAHHSLRTMGQPPASPFAPGDMGGSLDPNVHFGEGPRNSGQKLPCLHDEPALPTYPSETLRCLLLRHDSVVAFINGHEHNNRVTPYKDDDNAFWEVNTASHIDWPQQSRVFDVLDNGDDTLSLLATMVDHDSGPRTGRGVGAQAKQLAAISRELSAYEPQSGYDGARGDEGDRNVELLVDDPYPTP